MRDGADLELSQVTSWKNRIKRKPTLARGRRGEGQRQEGGET